MNKVLHCFADCMPVKGYNRSIIYDLTKRKYEFIPNTLYDILTTLEGKNWKEITSLFPVQEDIDILKEYFRFLEQKEYIVWIDPQQYEWFPKLTLEWDSPSEINNAIVDINHLSDYDLKDVFEQLHEMGCQAIQIRCFCNKDLKFWGNLLLLFKNTRIKS